MKVVKHLLHTESGLTPISEGNVVAGTTTPPLPSARADALSLAGQLWAGKTSHTLPVTLLFASPTAGLSVSRFVYETGLALCHMLTAPVLLVDLGGSNGMLSRVYTRTHSSDSIATHAPWTIDGGTTFALARLIEPTLSLLTAVSSERFVSFLEFARTGFSAVLLDVGAVPDSVVGVLAASHCDGIVLCLRPGKSTLSEVEEARTLFAQANSKLLGFVFDEIS